MARLALPGIVLLAATLHIVGIARTVVPAQDGLKFIRVAREFSHRPWADVVRGSDQHPLYPMAIALAAPVTSTVVGPGPWSWQLAAQSVSVVAALALFAPLILLTRQLFDRTTALLAALLYALLPATCEIGHDTLSDAPALSLFTTALWLGEVALRTGRAGPWAGCGLVAGLGYWTRPELAVLPFTILVYAGFRHLSIPWTSDRRPVERAGLAVASSRPIAGRFDSLAGWSMLAVGFLAVVGGYALVKGEVSEKLALRHAAAIASTHDAPKPVAHWLPPGLDRPEFDFAPKEESNRVKAVGPVQAAGTAAFAWAEALGWIFAPMVAVGVLRVRARSEVGRGLIALYAVVFGLILVRHAMGLGYLSGRHVLTLVVASLPWAAAGTLAVARRIAERFQWHPARRQRIAAACVGMMVVACMTAQARPAHASRWGHKAAGLWLAKHAVEGDAVLDTRGWAGFVSGLRSYDYWHVRQALTDQRLAFVVVGADELAATSRRGRTLRAILGRAGTEVASFPEERGGREPDVVVYRFTEPSSWEGLRP